MAQTASNAVYSKPKAGGAVWTAPPGTELPTDATSALAAAFTAWGYISDDGVTEGHSLSSDSQKAYGGAVVLVMESGDELTYEFTPLEYTNPVVQSELYGAGNVKATGKDLTSVQITDDSHEAKPFVYEHVLSNGIVERDVCPSAKVTGIDENTYSSSAALGPKVTVTPFPDEKGVKVYKYFAKVSDAAKVGE